MKIIVQAFTGGFHSANDPAGHKHEIDKLVSICEKAHADSVLIGWNVSWPYDGLVREMKQRSVKVFLWLPVFSEYGEDAVAALDFLGGRHENARTAADDDFSFACPGDGANIRLASLYYDKYFNRHGFDGIFLDKIRFSSYGNGFHSAMGCFCDACRDFYEREGVDMDIFAEMMAKPQKDFLIPDALHGLDYTFINPLMDSLFRARAKMITASTRKVADVFHDRGLSVGLDVFAPPFAYLVGQDIRALSDFATFIKPMMYNVTDAPAGVPYELRHMKAELMKNGCDIGGRLEKLWGTESLTLEDCFTRQLCLLKETNCDIYPGVEVNKVDFCATSDEYVMKTLSSIKDSGLAGAVLSWNVLAECVCLAFSYKTAYDKSRKSGINPAQPKRSECYEYSNDR